MFELVQDSPITQVICKIEHTNQSSGLIKAKWDVKIFVNGANIISYLFLSSS